MWTALVIIGGLACVAALIVIVVACLAAYQVASIEGKRWMIED